MIGPGQPNGDKGIPESIEGERKNYIKEHVQLRALFFAILSVNPHSEILSYGRHPPKWCIASLVYGSEVVSDWSGCKWSIISWIGVALYNFLLRIWDVKTEFHIPQTQQIRSIDPIVEKAMTNSAHSLWQLCSGSLISFVAVLPLSDIFSLIEGQMFLPMVP